MPTRRRRGRAVRLPLSTAQQSDHLRNAVRVHPVSTTATVVSAARDGDVEGSAPATLHDVERMLKASRISNGHSRERRRLIYNGKPTGGNKYPFLVSMWLSATTDVSGYVSPGRDKSLCVHSSMMD